MDDMWLDGHDPLGPPPSSGEPVLMTLREGRLLVIPQSMSRMTDDQREIVEEIQAAALRAAEARREVDDLLLEARDHRVSWSVLAFSLGLTERGVRLRHERLIDESRQA